MKQLWLGIFALAASAAFAQTAPVEGTVVSVVLDHVQIKTADGVKIAVLPAGVAVVKSADVAWTDIKPGEWVGVDSKPGADGAQESVSINIFSPSIIARARKGQFTMDSGDLMTNAPVEQLDGSMMNGTLTLKNDGAMVPIKVSGSTPVHRLMDGTVSDIKPNVHITVRGTANADGSVQAMFVSLK
jgi:hypothetical protein